MSTASLPADDAVHGVGAATRLIFAASLGNALEFYEILVYGYFALVISKVFFPAANEAVSLLVTYGTFGISFLARPVGAIFLGAYGDRKGRKNALTLSILLMTIGTALMTLMPSYATAGLAAPILVIAARLLQGFSVGGEFASSTTFLVEHRPDRSGFFASWQWSSQGFAALIATGLGVLLDVHHVGRRSAIMGLAHSLRGRSADRPDRLLHPPALAGDAGIPRRRRERRRRCVIFWSVNGAGCF